jgi:hypothetical protein
MTLKGWTVAAGLVLLAPCAPHAVMAAIVGPIIALAVVIALGSAFGSF